MHRWYIPETLASVVLALILTGVARGEDRTQTTEMRAKPAEKKQAAGIPIRLDHILNGGINRRGDLVGIHHLPSAPKQMRIDGILCQVEIKQTSPGGENDVVTAKILLVEPSTGKIVREKFSTLFPAAWNKTDIEQAIREAYAYAKSHDGTDRDGGFHGRSRGIRIDGYLTREKGAIATAFPVYQGPLAKQPSRRRP